MIQDHGTSEESLSIDRYLSAGLTKHTRILAGLTKHASTDEETAALAEAVVLMAGAALEAMLDESAYMSDRVLYDNWEGFRKKSPPAKFEKLRGSRSEEVRQIWNARIALSHAEPDNKRTGKVGRVLNPDEAVKIAGLLQTLANEIWGDHMPDWFSKNAGLT